MRLVTTQVKHGVVAVLDGEFTIHCLEELKDSFFGLLNCTNITLDLSQVTEYDGSALQMLAILMAECTRMQRSLSFTPVHTRMFNSMKMLGFDVPVIHAQEDRDESIQS